MVKNIAVVTGATSGLGFSAAKQLVQDGWKKVVITGRNQARLDEAIRKLKNETGKQNIRGSTLDLDSFANVRGALAELINQGEAIDFLLLNAGVMPGKKLVLTADQIESSQAPLIGHHQLTMGLLKAGLLADDSRIVIAGAEPARGDVPMFHFTDIGKLADGEYEGDRVGTIEAIFRGSASVKYDPYVAYSDAKVFIAWWAAALARKLPKDMAVYAVAPGSAPDTNAPRNLSFLMRHVMMPIAKRIPGMAHSVEEGAKRYLAASGFGVDVSGQFFASPPKKMTGPMEIMNQEHLDDKVNQEALWKAIVDLSGADI